MRKSKLYFTMAAMVFCSPLAMATASQYYVQVNITNKTNGNVTVTKQPFQLVSSVPSKARGMSEMENCLNNWKSITNNTAYNANTNYTIYPSVSSPIISGGETTIKFVDSQVTGVYQCARTYQQTFVVSHYCQITYQAKVWIDFGGSSKYSNITVLNNSSSSNCVVNDESNAEGGYLKLNVTVNG